MECQQDAANIKESGDEKRIGDLADEKISASDLEIVLQLTEVSIADNSGQRWNDAEDGVRRKDCRRQLAKQNCQIELKDYNHEAEIGEATEVSAANDTGEDWEAIDEQFHNVCRPLK